MKLNSVFPSKYLKSDDLQGREVTVTISKYALEKLDDDQKLVLYFVGKEKGLICNKTNANFIAHFYGDDLDHWIGKTILLGVEMVNFQGKITEAIRIKGRGVSSQAPAVVAEAPFDGEDAPF